MDSGYLLREIRRRQRLSQRELAERCGVAKSTIARIESGEADPPTQTLEKVLDGVGWRLLVVAEDGEAVQLDGDPVPYVQRDGRRFPAHLRIEPVTDSWDDRWWGWHRIAWWPETRSENPLIPTHTYHRRRGQTDGYPYDWDDAT